MMPSESRRVQEAADPFQRLSRDVLIAILGQISFHDRRVAACHVTALNFATCAC